MANTKSIYTLLISVCLVMNVYAEFAINNYDEMDPIIDMLLNGEYEKAIDPIDKMNNTDYQEGVKVEPILLYPDGVWKCGICDNKDQFKLLYSESYDHHAKFHDYGEDIGMEIQIGVALDNMRCITIKAEEDNMNVSLVSGACAGDQATLGVFGAAHFVMSVYG